MTRYLLGQYTPIELCPHPVEARVDPYWRTRYHVYHPPRGVIARCRDCGLILLEHVGWVAE